jgi:dTDP-4-dehydrorhamnose reductase
MDIADPDSVQAALEALRPWAVVNTAGYVRVADAERESAQCFRENAQGAAVLAQACADLDIAYVCFSSDLVFSGRLGRPYRESDPVDPCNIYGLSKAEAEQRILRQHPNALVVRTSAFFGPWDVYNFAHSALSSLACGKPVLASSATISPTYVPDLAHAVLDLLVDGAQGLWHLTNRGQVSWHEFALLLARQARLDTGAVERLDERIDGIVSNTALVSEKGLVMPSLEHGIERYLHDSRERWRAAAGQGRA